MLDPKHVEVVLFEEALKLYAVEMERLRNFLAKAKILTEEDFENMKRINLKLREGVSQLLVSSEPSPNDEIQDLDPQYLKALGSMIENIEASHAQLMEVAPAPHDALTRVDVTPRGQAGRLRGPCPTNLFPQRTTGVGNKL